MKKIAVVLCLLLIKLSLFGQSVTVVAGLNQSDFIKTPTTDDDNYKSITGFHAGLLFRFERRNFSIEPGLLFASIGGAGDIEDAHGAGAFGTFKYTVQYLQVPVNIFYNIPLSIGKVFFGGGPYLGVGLSGKTTQDLTIGSFSGASTIEHTASDYKFSNSDNPDYGLNAAAGIRFRNRLLLSLGYGYGLKYVFNKGGYGYNGGIKNNVASISIGYFWLH